MSERNGIVLTKAAILQGIEECKLIEVESLGGSVWIRRLGDGDIAEIEATQVRSGRMYEEKGKDEEGEDGPEQVRGLVSIPPDEFARNMREARQKAVAVALTNRKNGDEWTVQEVARLGRKVVNEIAEEVVRFSDLEEEASFLGWQSIEPIEEDPEEDSLVRREGEGQGEDV